MQRNIAHIIQWPLVFTTIIVIVASQSGGQAGALARGGIGALAGQAIGGNTKAMLIGAILGTSIGAAVGLVIGFIMGSNWARNTRER